MELVFPFYKEKSKERKDIQPWQHWYPTPLSVIRACWGRQSYRLQKGRLSVLPAAWQGTGQEQDEQLECWLRTFWCTQLPSLMFNKAAQYCHNWPCTILLYLSRGGGGTYFPRAPAVRTVNKTTLLMCRHLLSSSVHPVAQIQTLVTVQDPGIKSQTRKAEHFIILSLLTGIFAFLVLLPFKPLTHNSHTL